MKWGKSPFLSTSGMKGSGITKALTNGSKGAWMGISSGISQDEECFQSAWLQLGSNFMLGFNWFF